MVAAVVTEPNENSLHLPRNKWRHQLLFVAIFLLILLTYHIFLKTLPTPQEARVWILSQGEIAPVCFVLAFATCTPLFVPSSLFMIPAGIIWPNTQAFALSMTGAVLSCVVGFCFARHIARDYAERNIPSHFRKLVFFLSPLTHWFFGLSRIPFWAYILGSAAGITPGILVYVLLGAWLSSSDHWILVCVLVAAAVVIKAGILYCLHKKFHAYMEISASQYDSEESDNMKQSGSQLVAAKKEEIN